MSELTKEDRFTYWLLGFVVSAVLIATGYVGRMATGESHAVPVVVTNTVTRTVNVQTPDYFQIGWKDGVFWGALAVAKGATNLMDAETRAIAMRAEAVRANQQRQPSLPPKLESANKP